MPEVEPVYETSFQNMVDHEYSAKDRSVTPDFPNGQFGIQGGSSQVPRWTLDELKHELDNEDVSMTKNNRGRWKENAIQRSGIITNTLNAYADVLGKVCSKEYQNAPQEWLDACARVTA